MSTNLTSSPSVPADIGQITPELVNPYLLLDIADLIEPIISTTFPQKRSGFSYTVYILFVCCSQLLQLSPHHTAKHIHDRCLAHQISFQKYQTVQFLNGKNRRLFPDQPSLSRCLSKLSGLNLIEEFWNYVLLAQLLILKSSHLVKSELKLIADYTDTPCKKNKEDPYCFGKKEGKTVHRTLSFSVIAGEFHQIIANFKIKKRQDKLILFQRVIKMLELNDFCITYLLLDRGFYRKRLLAYFKQVGVTVIMPGRNCALTKQKITKYLLNKGKRYCKGFMKLSYIKKIGFPQLRFDLLLMTKRSFSLNQIKQDLRQKRIDLSTASKRIFPLLVLFGSKNGIKTLHGNEYYIRGLYRQRWLIEIAFREMNRLGISDKLQNRNKRLNIFGVKCVLYNIWQVQRVLARNAESPGDHLELNEFIGKCSNNRYISTK